MQPDDAADQLRAELRAWLAANLDDEVRRARARHDDDRSVAGAAWSAGAESVVVVLTSSVCEGLLLRWSAEGAATP